VILHGDPPSLTSVNSTVPAVLVRIVATCLAKDPDERWQSAHDVRLQLRAIADKPDKDGTTSASDAAGSDAVGRRHGWMGWVPTIRISTGGGSVARWSRDGKGLFYLSAETDRHLTGGPIIFTSHLVTVPIQTSPTLRVGTPVPLFELNPNRPWLEFDVSSAGRFLAVVSETRASEQPLTVVLNWTAEAGRRLDR
jgi:hypothetical protein